MEDKRYEFVRCPACGQQWQFIDFGCALHRLICQAVDTENVRAAVLSAWQAVQA